MIKGELVMHIDDFGDRGYCVDPEGCHWSDPESYLQGYILGMCCCGDPESNLKLVAELLISLRDAPEPIYNGDWKTSAIHKWNEARDEKYGEDMVQFMWYFLDEKELTEHGGSIPGWITDKGIAFIKDVEEYYSET